MIRKYAPTIACVVLLAGFVVLSLNGSASAQQALPEAALAPAANVGSSFSYQGYLQQGGVAVNGSCDFEFRLFGAATAGTQIGTTQSINGQAISQGRFTVELNFGAGAMDGQARWLQIAVRCPGGSGVFTALTPRQVLTATPYALSLQPGAVVAGAVSSAGILNLTNSGMSSSDIGLNVLSAPIGVQVDSASLIGVQVNSAGGAGVFVDSAGNNGFQVYSAANNGLQVQSATGNGVQVDSAGNTGVRVDSADVGVWVDTVGVGVWVDTTTTGGVYVRSAGTVGLQVESALNGVQVDNATGIGVAVGSAVNGVQVDSATNWAGYFNGPIYSQTCTGCLMATFGINTSAAILAPGDIVAIRGARLGDATGQPMLMEVGPARAGEPVVGVVYGRSELVTEALTDAGETKQRLAPREGAAKPGEYVHIIIYGPVQVKANTVAKAIATGEKLAINDRGAARSLQTVEVSGVRLSESAPTIGIALESLEANQNGLIWVLVNPQ